MATKNWLTKYIERVLALDLRSLALFRVALGVLILADLVHRWPVITDMFTEDGFFTRERSFQFYDQQYDENWPQFFWSVYWLSDSAPFVYTLHVVAAFFAILLIVGKWTRVATIASWILLASLHVRNPLVTSSGDFLFKMMLFWSIFLPLNAKWAVDARNQSKPPSISIVSLASTAYIVQLLSMYFFSGLAKWNSVWLAGDALEFVMRLNIYVRDFGIQLLEYPELLTLTTWATLFAELFLLWTMFVFWNNGFWRMLNYAIFALFHVGIAVSLSIGMFPWICIVAWIPLIPSTIWWSQEPDNSVTNQFHWHEISTWGIAVEAFCGLVLLLVVAWNFGNVEHPYTASLRSPLVKNLGIPLAIDQHFKMFGVPPKENPWFVYEGRLANGKQIDIWRESKLDLTRPESGLRMLPQFHWRKFHRNALVASNQIFHEAMLAYAVKSWNESHPDPDHQVVHARLICFTEPIGPDYQEKSNVSKVWAQYGSTGFRPGSLFDSFLQEDDDLPF